jgi:hypothetical protein
LQYFASNLGLSTCGLGEQFVADGALDVGAASLEDKLLIGAFETFDFEKLASRFGY